MSVFTNPASGAKEQADAYIEALLSLLGDQDPLAVLRETPGSVRSLIEGLSDAELTTPEAEGKWSMLQLLQHLTDSELIWGYRLRRALAEDRPRIEGYDQDLWVDRLHYASTHPDRALAMFDALRAVHMAMLESATDEELARYGVHAERGDESVAHMMKLYSGHDLLHVRQLARIREAVKQG